MSLPRSALDRFGSIVETRYRWGTAEVSGPGRWGTHVGRVVVLPPGTSSDERRRYSLASQIAPTTLVVSAVVFAVSVAVSGGLLWWVAVVPVACGAAAAISTRRLRASGRELCVTWWRTGSDLQVDGDLPLFMTVLDELRRMERMRDSGLLDPVGYELAWDHIYRRIPVAASPSSVRATDAI